MQDLGTSAYKPYHKKYYENNKEKIRQKYREKQYDKKHYEKYKEYYQTKKLEHFYIKTYGQEVLKCEDMSPVGESTRKNIFCEDI